MGGLENAEDALNLRPDIELFQARTVLFNTQIWIDPTRFYKVIELKRVFFYQLASQPACLCFHSYSTPLNDQRKC